jgi:hypothetical protein
LKATEAEPKRHGIQEKKYSAAGQLEIAKREFVYERREGED